jgi:D-alanyl-D-alanine dipeptidase
MISTLSVVSVESQELPAATSQLVVVVSANWEAAQAELWCMEKTTEGWRVALSWPVTIGKKGLGWGRGLHTISDGPVKKEGDLKSPAGLFTLEKRLYGYAPNPPPGTRLLYAQTNKEWLWVDDPASRYYNQMVQKKTITMPDWNSYEEMRRDDNLYQWLLVVEHNLQPSVPGAGSCIAIHLWRSPQTPTAGCTAMSEENLLRLAAWLDPQRSPLLLQLPLPVYEVWRGRLTLPR